METLVTNMAQQINNLIRLPIQLIQFKKSTIYQVLSWLLGLLFVASIGVLISGGVDESNKSGIDLLKIGTFLYVLSLNCYFIIRQYIYYSNQASRFQHDPRFIALANTNFNTFDSNWSNYLQIAVLGLEFVQLLSFPIQDIIAALSRDGADSQLDMVISIASLLPGISVRFYLVQFWTCMGVVSASVLGALAVHLYNDRTIPGISVFWVSGLVPVVHVAYLPILVTFINSAGCLLGNSTSEQHSSLTQILKCERQVIQPQLYLWLSLLGFTMAYVLLTMFVTSYERKPLEGDIEFKSKGVAFIKNMSLLLTIDFTLIPLEYAKVKGIFSVVILTAVVIYSIQSRPCYVSQINFWRTVGFSCILWSALPVAILDLPAFGATHVIILILVGWSVILMISIGGRYCAYAHLTSTPKPRSRSYLVATSDGNIPSIPNN